MTNRPNTLLFAATLAGTIVTGIWMAQYFFGREPSWGVGAALFFFLVLGTTATKLNIQYNFWEADMRHDDQKNTAELMAYFQQLADNRTADEVGTMQTTLMNGRVVQRFKPTNPREAKWIDACAGFLLHAWAAQSLSGPALVGRAVKYQDDWFAITEVLMHSGFVTKANGVGTAFAKGWTFRKAIAAIQLGEVRLTLPDADPPPTLNGPLNAPADKVEKVEAEERPGKAVEAYRFLRRDVERYQEGP